MSGERIIEKLLDSGGHLFSWLLASPRNILIFVFVAVVLVLLVALIISGVKRLWRRWFHSLEKTKHEKFTIKGLTRRWH